MLTVVGDSAVDIFVPGVEGLAGVGAGEPSAAEVLRARERVVPTLGGSGARTAYILGALGELVRLWSAVGADSFGDMALGWLEGRQVDTASVRLMKEEGTSTSIVVSDEQSRRQIFHYAGASAAFAPRVRAVSGGVGDWLLVTGYALLPGWRGEVTLEVLCSARRSGIGTALDFGPLMGERVAGEELGPLLRYASLLLCDAGELEQVAGVAGAGAAAWALEAGAGAVVLRQGVEGTRVFGSAGSEGTDVPGFKVDAITSAGVGEGFNAGFLYAHSRGESLEESARFGNALAAMLARAARGVLDAPGEGQVREFMGRRG